MLAPRSVEMALCLSLGTFLISRQLWWPVRSAFFLLPPIWPRSDQVGLAMWLSDHIGKIGTPCHLRVGWQSAGQLLSSNWWSSKWLRANTSQDIMKCKPNEIKMEPLGHETDGLTAVLQGGFGRGRGITVKGSWSQAFLNQGLRPVLSLSDEMNRPPPGPISATEFSLRSEIS